MWGTHADTKPAASAAFERSTNDATLVCSPLVSLTNAPMFTGGSLVDLERCRP